VARSAKVNFFLEEAVNPESAKDSVRYRQTFRQIDESASYLRRLKVGILRETFPMSQEDVCKFVIAADLHCQIWIDGSAQHIIKGEEFFQHRLVFDRSSLTRWRQRMGEEKLVALLQESLAVATRTEAMRPKDLARVIIDTTVQPKAVMFPIDAKRLAKRYGVVLCQSYVRVDKIALIKHQRYAHATNSGSYSL
jgi:hypothetical protein